MYVELGESHLNPNSNYFHQIKTKHSRKPTFSYRTLCSGYLHAPKLASLLNAGAGARACAFLSASSIGGTSGTSAPPGAFLTVLVKSLLSLADDRGVLFGSASTTSRLASLGARSWYYWRSSGAPLTDVSQALALSVAVSAGGVAGGGSLLRCFSNSTGVVPPALLFWQGIFVPRRYTLLLVDVIFQKSLKFQKHKQKSSDRRPESRNLPSVFAI